MPESSPVNSGIAAGLNPPLLAALRSAGLVEESLLLATAQESQRTGQAVYDLLLEKKPDIEVKLWRALAAYLGFPFNDMVGQAPAPELVRSLPSAVAFSHGVAPLALAGQMLTLAVSRPETLTRLDQISSQCGLDLTPVMAPPTALQRFIRGLYGLGAETVDRLTNSAPEPDSTIRILAAEAHDIDHELDRDQEASITRFVNQILIQAVRDGASDVHIEPYEKALRVRFRVDGQLLEIAVPPNIKQLEAAIISRLKVLADMDIAEKRLPQDGQMRLQVVGRLVDVRVSILPTIYGEGLVLRLLDRQSQFRRLDDIGMDAAMLESYRGLLELAQGLILVTGPTGSGKTTTLYASLNHVNQSDIKIITIEDPVEYRLEGLTQLQVKEMIGLSFSTLLRNIVRHDPDVIMVGEIRDNETAQIALNSAMTGHLVFSTLHTNDAPSAVTRLLNMGVPSYLISASLKVVLAQRLVRLLCPSCRREVAQAPAAALGEFSRLQGRRVYVALGCEQCRQSGYRGRTAIYEFFVLSDQIVAMILAGASVGNIRAAAMQNGMRPLAEAGIDLVLAGRTSLEEVYRVTRDVPHATLAVAGGSVS